MLTGERECGIILEHQVRHERMTSESRCEVKRKNQYEDVEIRAEAERLIRNHTFEKTKNFKKKSLTKTASVV